MIEAHGDRSSAASDGRLLLSNLGQEGTGDDETDTICRVTGTGRATKNK